MKTEHKLRHRSAIDLPGLLKSPAIERHWLDAQKAIGRFTLPDGAGGVNPGDRRALYYLISALAPTSVLEIGTRIGASTVHIAAALRQQAANGQAWRLVSVDISDVNNSERRPWQKAGASHSPAAMIGQLGCGEFVEFVTSGSLAYLKQRRSQFDCIFLGGDHSEENVYAEIPLALECLNPDGVILLHDYFPQLEPLWSDGSVEKGPYMATENLLGDGYDFSVEPLGRLPWPTKLESNITSLALLLQED